MRRTVTGTQNVSRMCLVCGRANDFGLKASFLELEGDELLGIFRPLEVHQSYPGRMHGGVATAILDETIGRAITMHDPEAWGVTIELNVRFRRPVPVDGELRALGRITKHGGRIFEGSGEILLPDGSVAAEATGRFLRQPIDRIAEGDFDSEWFPDPAPAPGDVDV